MKKQKFVHGAWRTACASRALRYTLILVVAVAVGVLAGRALSDRSDPPGRGASPGAAETRSLAGPAQADAVAAALPASSGSAPGSDGPGGEDGVTVSQVVPLGPVQGAGPGFIEDIPNVDFTGLSPDQKKEAVRLLNERRCNCNCQMTLAQCRRDDRSCPRSPEIVARFLAAIRKGDSPAQAADRMYVEAGAPAAQPAAAAPAARSDKLLLFKVDPGEAPSAGPAGAPVTIIKFLDFQCPFCARADETLERLVREYPGKIRVVYKQHPLPMHAQAMIAAEAALAAHEQRRYKEMHARLYGASRELSRDRILAIASEIGLDMKKFTSALDSGKHRAAIEADSKQAMDLGATGTPAFFINGRFVSGARPYEQFKSIVDEELSGKRPPFEWGTHVREQRDREEAVLREAALRQEQEEAKRVYTVDLKGAVATGSERAAVIIVEFTDFQCPFCQRVQPTLKQILQEYKGKVRLVTKNLPLAFHPQARPAARAALAAHRQGKYWEYRDLLFANNRNLSEDQLVAHARSLGLNMEKFRADMGSPEIEQTIASDERIAQEIGASGTPTFLINGRKLVGAQPLEAFKQRIEAELTGAGRGAQGR